MRNARASERKAFRGLRRMTTRPPPQSSEGSACPYERFEAGEAKKEKACVICASPERHPLLKKMYEKERLKRLCDVVLIIEQQELPAHKAVLASASPVFEAMLTGDMKESHCQDYPQRLLLSDVHATAFRKLLEFIYTGEISVTFSEALLVLQAAHMYQMEDVLKALEEFLRSQLSDDRHLELWQFAVDYELAGVQREVVSYASQEFPRLIHAPEFKSTPLELLIEILKHRKELAMAKKGLKISTSLKGAFSWISADEPGRSRHADCLLSHLNLSSTLDQDELEEVGQELVDLAPTSAIARSTLRDIFKRLQSSRMYPPRMASEMDCHFMMDRCRP